MPTDPSYLAAWRRYRRWRFFFWILFLGWLPYALTVNMAVDGLGSAWHIAVTLPWIVIIVIASLKTALFSCPRCGEVFHGIWNRNPFARVCRSCGLHKWALRDPNQPVDPVPEGAAK
jgi:hypothetical protein